MIICTETGNYHFLLCKPSGELPELHGIKHSLDVVNDAGEVFQYCSLKKQRMRFHQPEASGCLSS